MIPLYFVEAMLHALDISWHLMHVVFMLIMPWVGHTSNDFCHIPWPSCSHVRAVSWHWCETVQKLPHELMVTGK
jgi:hypothetical protein